MTDGPDLFAELDAAERVINHDGPYRILVTGSRTWDDWPRIAFELGVAIGQSGHPLDNIVIVHGSCPRGADAIADRIAASYGCQVERHPADWERCGKQAGFIRSAEMVRLGADLALAFIRGNSAGATHCATMAAQAGIEIRRFTCA